MQNSIIETVIVLGTTGLIVALFANAYNKALGITHKREIELLEFKYGSQINSINNEKNKLQADINLLCGSTASDNDRRLIIKHYNQRMEMKNIMNAIKLK